MEISSIYKLADQHKARITGIVNRSQDPNVLSDRYAMAREGFVQGVLWMMEFYKKGKPLIIMIVGDSGAGKDTFADILCECLPMAKKIVSYTTREKREGEEDGREHYFVKDYPHGETFAHTVYGGKHYWTTEEQFDAPVNIYIVDEVGLEAVSTQYLRCPSFNSYSVLIKRDNIDVGEERTSRDKDRLRLNEKSYSRVVINNGTIDDLRAIADDIINKLR